MDDLISRKAAIKTICENCFERRNFKLCTHRYDCPILTALAKILPENQAPNHIAKADTKGGLMKVYIITAGSYSDYHIEAVYADKEKAELFLEMFNSVHDSYYGANIEEYEVDKIKIERGQTPYLVEMKDDGGITRVEKTDYPCDIDKYDTPFFYVAARSIEHAIKKAYDIRAQYMAEKEGL